MAKKQKAAVGEVMFEGVIIRGGSLHNSDERHVRLEFTASWTESIRSEMGWADPDDRVGAMDLVGTIPCSTVRFVPSAPVAKNGTIDKLTEEFSAEECRGFNLVPLKDKGGELLGRELRFTIKSNQIPALGMCGRYVGRLGRAPGTLVVTMANEPRQSKLAPPEDTETETAAE